MNLDDIIKQSIDNELIGMASTINAYKLLLYASGLPIDDKNRVKISVKDCVKHLNIKNKTNVYRLLDAAIIQLMGVSIDCKYKNKFLFFKLVGSIKLNRSYLELKYTEEFAEYLKKSSISKNKIGE